MVTLFYLWGESIFAPMKIRIQFLKILLVLFGLVMTYKSGRAQLIYQPYSFQFYQKLNADVYDPATGLHTAVKPFLFGDSSSLRPLYDSLMRVTTDPNYKSWILRKIFNEHLIDTHAKDFTFYLDYFPDLQVGREFTDKTNTWLNTRGYQVGGTIGSNFFFYTSGYENQAVFPDYISEYVTATGMVPGQAYDFNRGKLATKSWTYVTSLIGYKPAHSVVIEAGIDKTFIGDGYRSMLLSDFASPYPLLRLRADLAKNVQYTAMWAYMQNLTALTTGLGHVANTVKWGAFHFIDWNITKRASIGFFNALMAPGSYDNGVNHGFDVNYIDPILFAKSLAPSGPIPDNTYIGLNAKYKVLDKTTIYSQLLFDQSGANFSSKQSFQLGVRGADLFGAKSLNYLVEYNTAKPYTYSNQYPLVNYAYYNETLADPLGANFSEVLGILNYSAGKFDFQGELDYAKSGLNNGNMDYGQDILLPEHRARIGNDAQIRRRQNILFNKLQD
jgi:hypothetical protein